MYTEPLQSFQRRYLQRDAEVGGLGWSLPRAPNIVLGDAGGNERLVDFSRIIAGCPDSEG